LKCGSLLPRYAQYWPSTFRRIETNTNQEMPSMFSSIRSRLWLTYVLTIVTALLVVAVVFIIYLLDNPLVYRQTRLRLAAVQSELLASQASWTNLPADQLQPFLAAQDKELDARLLVVNPRRQIIADSRAEKAASLETGPIFRLFRLNHTVTDAQGQSWLYVSRKLDNGNFLVATFPRPQISFWNVFTDELMPPLLWGGALALVLALFIAFWVARWVVDPIQKLVNATHEFSGGEAKPLELKGPREVRELADAFNQMMERVQVGQRAQREFVANVSHELKTPLTSIQGFSQAILDGTAYTLEQQKQSAQVIFNEAERMYRMALNLLDLTRLDAGIADLKRAPVDLTALLKSIGERFAPQAHKAGVTLEIKSADLLPIITGDGDRLAQVLTNLVDNALKFTKLGGRVLVSTILAGNFIDITVADTGVGIPPEALPRIFDRFYQADVSRRGGKKHGAGLGLAIVREIVEAHGGKISVHSVVGQGSEFVVRLPLVDPAVSTIMRKKS
jgi:two-component system, OmpR family, sensor kinase